MDYATVYTSLNMNLHLAQQTSLQLSQFVVDYATVYESLIVSWYLAAKTSLQLSQFVMDYATAYISLIVNLYIAWQNNLTVEPICNGLCNCVYKFNSKLVFRRAL